MDPKFGLRYEIANSQTSMSRLEQQHNYEHHRGENGCCAHERTPTEFAPNLNVTGNFQTTLQVAGVDCAEEVSAIRRALKPLAGVRDVSVNIMSGKAIIVHDERTTPDTLIKAIGNAGLKAAREGEKSGDRVHQAQKQRLLAVSISGALTLFGLLLHWTHFAPEPVAVGLFAAAIISGGWFIAPKAVAAARRLAPDMNLLMAIAILGAGGIGEWSEGAAVAFLFALSELLESFSVARARRAIQSLLKLSPETAALKNGDVFDEVPVCEVLHAFGDDVCPAGFPGPADSCWCGLGRLVLPSPGATGHRMPVCTSDFDSGVYCLGADGDGSSWSADQGRRLPRGYWTTQGACGR